MFCKKCGVENKDDATFCKSCGAELHKVSETSAATPVFEKQVERSDSQFLYIPLSRYVIMSVITFGLYQAYWIFKNWEYLKNRDNLKIHPFWRGIFGIFFCHELLQAIHDDPILNKNTSAQFDPSSLATGWVIIVILEGIFNYVNRTLSNGLIFIILLSLIVIELLFFIPVQRYINSSNEKINPAPNYYPWSSGHFVMIGIVMAIFLFGALGAIYAPASVHTSEISQPPTPIYLATETMIPLATSPQVTTAISTSTQISTSASVSNSADTSASFNSAGTLYTKSVNLANAGDYQDALNAADAALADNVSSLIPIIQSNRAGILVALGRYDEAIVAADVAINTPGNPNNLQSIAYYNKANALQALGRSAEADANYANASALNPSLKHP